MNRSSGLILLATLAMALCHSCQARSAAGTNFGVGQVSASGSVVETPCAIAFDDRHQIIQLPAESIGQMISGGKSQETQLDIELVGCSPVRREGAKPSWSAFNITFDGAREEGGLFALAGESAGFGLQISDSDGEIAIPGQSMSRKALPVGDAKLAYKLQLIGVPERLEPGSYQASIRFKIDYF